MVANTKAQELLEQAGPLVDEQRKLVEKYAGEKMSAEDETKYQALNSNIEQLRRTAERIIQVDEYDKAFVEMKKQAAESRGESTAQVEDELDDTLQRGTNGAPTRKKSAEELESKLDQRTALRAWLMAPSGEVDAKDLDHCRQHGFNLYPQKWNLICNRPKNVGGFGDEARTADELNRRYREANWEERALGTSPATVGGNTVPDEMMRTIDVAMLRAGRMRQTSTILSTATGADLPIPTTNDTANKGALIGENAADTEQDVAFGQVVFRGYTYTSKMVKISIELLQDNAINLEALLGSLLGTRIARITSEHFTTGDGAAKPTGIVTAAADSSVTTASNTAFTLSEMIQIEHTVDPDYRDGAGWMVHDKSLEIIKKMVNSSGTQMFIDNIAAGGPMTLLGYPINVNQEMPNGASSKGILFGLLSKYLIRDVLGLQLVRLTERYAENRQVAFSIHARFDGNLIDAGTNPVKYATLAA